MGILDRLRRKKEPLPPLPPPEPEPKPDTGLSLAAEGNVKAKIELMMTQMDSLQTQYAALNERIKNIERLVTEIRSFCK